MPALSDRDRDLLAMLGRRVPDAEIAVRLGAPIATVKANIERLMGLASATTRAELLAWDPDLAEPSAASVPFPAPTPVRPVSAVRRIGRRALLAGTAGIAASGGAVVLTRLAGSRPQPAPGALPTPVAAPSFFAPRPAAGIVDRTSPETQFELAKWGPGEPIGWEAGIFFMNTQGGAVTGFRPAGFRSRAADAPPVRWWSLADMLIAGASAGPEVFFHDRRTGVSEAWTLPPTRTPVAVGSAFVITHDWTTPAAGPPGNQEFEVYDRAGEPVTRFALRGVGHSWLGSPAGERAAAWHADGWVRMVDLRSGSVFGLIPPPDGYRVATGPGAAGPGAHLLYTNGAGESLVRAFDLATMTYRDIRANRHAVAPDGQEYVVEREVEWTDGTRVPAIESGEGVRLAPGRLASGEGSVAGPWLADSRAFLAIVAVAAPGDGVHAETVLIDRDLRAARRLPPWPWATDATPAPRVLADGVPSPHDPTLVCFQRVELCNLRTGRWLRPSVRVRPSVMNPWSAREEEMVFSLPGVAAASAARDPGVGIDSPAVVTTDGGVIASLAITG